MTTTIHKNLTGADLHEPKGAAAALAGQVYVADGLGSGAWTPASSVVTNTAFSTGDLKLTHKSIVDTGWIFWVDGTIGDGSSSATVRANADTSALFTLYWGNGNCLISGGKGVSAAADFAAHKALFLPPGDNRLLAKAGTNTVGTPYGALTVTLVAANLPPVTSSGSNSIIVNSSVNVLQNMTVVSSNAGGGSLGQFNSAVPPANNALTSSGSNSITVTSTGTTSTPVNVSPLSTAVNVMIKL